VKPEAMDFYWKRSGLRWNVMSEERREGESEWGHRATLFTCWRQKTAADVCLRIFEAYGAGCSIGRSRAIRDSGAAFAALREIKSAALEGRVCDDVAWFGPGETLHDFCDRVLDDVGGSGT
jgi:hypothetical protein